LPEEARDGETALRGAKPATRCPECRPALECARPAITYSGFSLAFNLIIAINRVFRMTRSITRRERRLPLAVLALSLVLATAAVPARAMGDNGLAAVRSLYSTLLAAMRNGPALGPQGRYARIAPVVRQVFDIPLMTRLAVGPDWASLSAGQRQRVTQAFERYITAVYAERFDSYSGELLQVTGVEASTGGTIITSRIVKSDGEPVAINYLMRDNGGVWQIADVYLDGTISELATRRSEFASILRMRGIDGLIETLNSKAAALTRAS
jgi:phospholipid transport system substrate-binding protein